MWARLYVECRSCSGHTKSLIDRGANSHIAKHFGMSRLGVGGRRGHLRRVHAMLSASSRHAATAKRSIGRNATVKAQTVRRYVSVPSAVSTVLFRRRRGCTVWLHEGQHPVSPGTATTIRTDVRDAHLRPGYRGPTDQLTARYAPLRVTQPVIACRCGFCFQFAACYEAHLPSVTVRDENAGLTHCKHFCSSSHSSDKRCGRRGMMTTRCIAMSVGKVSDGTVQRDVMVDTCQLQPHLETKHVRKKRRPGNASAAQCCSVLFQGMTHARQVGKRLPLEVT
jgi:hypothetical protein